MDIKYAGQPVQRSPYTANVYDASRVRLVDAPSSGVVGNDVHFTGLYNYKEVNVKRFASRTDCSGDVGARICSQVGCETTRVSLVLVAPIHIGVAWWLNGLGVGLAIKRSLVQLSVRMRLSNDCG